ncbi:hypothetical protein [Streptomyces flavochromogenes]|uniref:hypothetical protein n=1 Tax=Streptomyces flavochromogenes TaxID=68199 RepID=UPI0004C271B0|nr:hypothetical protein [Streptomyces flavochromogenes]
MTRPSPADELRTAAEKLRDYTEDLPGYLQGMAEPVAQLLDHQARIAREVQDYLGDEFQDGALDLNVHNALAVARAITGDTP